MTVETHTEWRTRTPSDLIGHRCIATTLTGVTLDGPLDLDRLGKSKAILKYKGVRTNIIICDLTARLNKPAPGIRSIIITESKP